MKLKLILLPLLLAFTAVAGESIAQQEARLNKALWFNQKLFGLTEQYITVHVKHMCNADPCKEGQTKASGVWGDELKGEIEVVALEDMPAQMPMKTRIKFQEDILQHEVMHIVLGQADVPDEAQDALIGVLLHRLQKP